MEDRELNVDENGDPIPRMEATVIDDVEEVTPVPASSIVLARADIDAQIATARAYPRDLAAVRSGLLAMVTMDEETAATCSYALNRQGKKIEGPTVHFAQMLAHNYGNIHAEVRVVDENARFVTARAVAWDLQNNVREGMEVRRRITNKHGQTFNDDMIVVTSNAVSSIALRNAILKVIPGPIWLAAWRASRALLAGEAKDLPQRRASMVEYFAKLGVPAASLLKVVNRSEVDQISADELVTLRGIAQAIKDGDTTIESAFGKPATGQRSDLTDLVNNLPRPAAAEPAAPAAAPT